MKVPIQISSPLSKIASEVLLLMPFFCCGSCLKRVNDFLSLFHKFRPPSNVPTQTLPSASSSIKLTAFELREVGFAGSCVNLSIILPERSFMINPSCLVATHKLPPGSSYSEVTPSVCIEINGTCACMGFTRYRLP